MGNFIFYIIQVHTFIQQKIILIPTTLIGSRDFFVYVKQMLKVLKGLVSSEKCRIFVV